MENLPKLISTLRTGSRERRKTLVEEAKQKGGSCPRDKYACGDCQCTAESYIVNNELWNKHGNGKGVLCLTCFEKRLGRPFELSDFRPVQANVTIFYMFDLLRRKSA